MSREDVDTRPACHRLLHGYGRICLITRLCLCCCRIPALASLPAPVNGTFSELRINFASALTLSHSLLTSTTCLYACVTKFTTLQDLRTAPYVSKLSCFSASMESTNPAHFVLIRYLRCEVLKNYLLSEA